MNQLVSQQAGGALVFKGSVSEPASVTLGGKPATVTADNRFEGQAVVPGGTGQVAVTATDPSGNVRTSTYQVSQGATSKAFTYDLNGNATSDGTRTFEWDAENRLVAIAQGSRRSEFAYDGSGIRAAVVEKDGGAVLTDRRLVLCGSAPCEERDGAGSVTRRFFSAGMQQGTSTLLFAGDHLGSVRDVTDGDGVLQARYDYDLYGRRSLQGSEVDVPKGFAGLSPHAPSGFGLASYRAYDPTVGRWLSQDPAGRVDGPNLYWYGINNPVAHADPLGLQVVTRDCGDKAAAIQAAAGKAEAAVQCCLPQGEDKKAWTRKIRSTTYNCRIGLFMTFLDPLDGRPTIMEIPGACAAALDGSGEKTGIDVTFYDLAFSKSGICGCLQGLLLHEIAHLMGKNHPEPDKIARGCFSCTR